MLKDQRQPYLCSPNGGGWGRWGHQGRWYKKSIASILTRPEMKQKIRLKPHASISEPRIIQWVLGIWYMLHTESQWSAMPDLGSELEA